MRQGGWRVAETERSRRLGFVALCAVLSTAGALGAARAHRRAPVFPDPADAVRVEVVRRISDCAEPARRDPRIKGCYARPLATGVSDERTVRR